MEDHFTRLNVNLPGLERIEEGLNAGKVKYSFANLMAIHHPMVIMDEAHNARTGLSFDALCRVSPSCIVELTATPDTTPRTGSNVLHRVSASELKAEDMIKLPIVLTIHEESWESAIGDQSLRETSNFCCIFQPEKLGVCSIALQYVLCQPFLHRIRNFNYDFISSRLEVSDKLDYLLCETVVLRSVRGKFGVAVTFHEHFFSPEMSLRVPDQLFQNQVESGIPLPTSHRHMQLIQQRIDCWSCPPPCPHATRREAQEARASSAAFPCRIPWPEPPPEKACRLVRTTKPSYRLSMNPRERLWEQSFLNAQRPIHSETALLLAINGIG